MSRPFLFDCVSFWCSGGRRVRPRLFSMPSRFAYPVPMYAERLRLRPYRKSIVLIPGCENYPMVPKRPKGR